MKLIDLSDSISILLVLAMLLWNIQHKYSSHKLWYLSPNIFRLYLSTLVSPPSPICTVCGIFSSSQCFGKFPFGKFPPGTFPSWYISLLVHSPPGIFPPLASFPSRCFSLVSFDVSFQPLHFHFSLSDIKLPSPPPPPPPASLPIPLPDLLHTQTSNPSDGNPLGSAIATSHPGMD